MYANKRNWSVYMVTRKFKKYCLFSIVSFLILNQSRGADKNIAKDYSNAVVKVETNNFKSSEGQAKVNLNLDERTAVKIAEVILSSIYGEGVLKQRPWIITDNGRDFKIVGTFYGREQKMKGGVAEITIGKSDARIIKYIHGK